MNKKLRSIVSVLLAMAVSVSNIGMNMVYASEDTQTNSEQDVSDDTEGADNENKADEDKTSESADAELKYVYVESPYLEITDHTAIQNIVVTFNEGHENLQNVSIIVEKADGSIEEWECNDSVDQIYLFSKEFTSVDAGTYTVVSVNYSQNGEEKKLCLLNLNALVEFGINEEYEGYGENTVDLEYASEELETTIVTFDEDGEMEVQDSITSALEEVTGAKAGTVKSRSSNIVVALDPGHDSKHAGAQKNGLSEEVLTLKIANYAKAELETYEGVSVYMTRTTAACPYPSSSNSGQCIKQRAYAAAAAGARIYVSIHLNSEEGFSAKGAEVIYPNNSWKAQVGADGKALAQSIQNELVKIGLKDRGIYYKNTSIGETYDDGSVSDYFSVQIYNKENGIPGIIIEHAFMSNSSDASKYLKTEAGLKSLGIADATGIANFLGLYKKGEKSPDKGQINYSTYVQNSGWQSYGYDGATSGTVGQSKRIEGIKISLNSSEYSGYVSYRTHMSDYGWMDWIQENDYTSGIPGGGKQMEAIEIKLNGEIANYYDIYYRAYVEDTGWQTWMKNGETAGTTEQGKKMEAIQMVMVVKSGCAPGTTASPSKVTQILYSGHSANVGWGSYVPEGITTGTTGKGLRLEAIKISLDGAAYEGSISYKTHVQDYGWMNWVQDGALSGTTGKSKQMEAICIQLTGEMAENYDIYYRAHVQDYGWLDWAKNGEVAGTTGKGKQMEALQIVLVEKDESAPGATTTPAHLSHVNYSGHSANVGWGSYVSEGATAGTTGKSLRLESLKISLNGAAYSGSISYKAHVQNVGWQGWVKDGAVAGTTGQAKRMEAVCIQLSGEIAEYYDVYYRAHVADYGWLDWAKNGQIAGTTGLAKQMEAIQIVLVKKGSAAPGAMTTPSVTR